MSRTDRGSQGARRRHGGSHRPAPRRAVLLGAVGLLAATALAAPAQAAEPTLIARQLTSPGAILELGDSTNGYSTWVSDHLLGFCRIDGMSINQTTCNTQALSPGQASFDAATNKVYVPDNSAKSVGVVQLTYDPVAKAITSGRLFGSGLSGNRPSGTALYQNTLFVTGLKDGIIRRIGTANPLASAQAVGQTSDAGGSPSLALSGDTLYIAQGEGISTLNAAAAATSTGGMVANLASNPHIGAPSAVAADRSGIYVTEVDLDGASTLIRWSFTGEVADFAEAGMFAMAAGVTRDAAGDATAVFVGDEPSDGTAVQSGRGFRYDPAAAPRRILGTAALPHSAGTGGGGGGGGTPTPDGTRVATTLSTGPASPTGYITLGGNPWVVTRSAGVCAIRNGTVGPCTTGNVGVAGQPSTLSGPAGTTYVLVPDSGPQGGVVRLTYNPTADSVGSPARLGQGLKNPMSASAISGRNVVVGGPGSGNLLRMPVDTPATKATTIGRVANPVTGMARLGADLLVTSSTGVQVVSGIDTCGTRCNGSSTPIATSGAPTAITSDGATRAFIASGSHVERFDTGPAGGVDPNWVATYQDTPTTTAGLGSVSGLGVDTGSGTLLLGDGQRSYSAATQ